MKFINIHTHQKDSKNFSIVNCYPNSLDFSTPFSIGIHPWYINSKELQKDFLKVESYLEHQNCYAVGECGLDKLSKVDFNTQLKVFKKQIELSEEYCKPLLIHCVKSFQELLQLKKEINPQQEWIIHGFVKNLQVATSLIKQNCYLSFGNHLLKSSKLEEVFKNISIDSIFLETDDKDVNIKDVYKKAAIIKEIEIENLKQKIDQNFNKVFKK